MHNITLEDVIKQKTITAHLAEEELLLSIISSIFFFGYEPIIRMNVKVFLPDDFVALVYAAWKLFKL